MNKPAPKEPSMDEILSSIRQIIADDEGAVPPRRPSLQAAPAPMEATPAAPRGAAAPRPGIGFNDVLEPLALKPDQILREAEPETAEIDDALEDEIDDEPVASGLSFEEILADTAAEAAAEAEEDEEPEETAAVLSIVDPEDVAFDLDEVDEPDEEAEAFAAALDDDEPLSPPIPEPTPAVSTQSTAQFVPERPRPSPMPDPDLSADMAEQLLEPATNAAVRSTFARLNSLGVGTQGLTIEAMVRDMLRPMLKEWLDEHLPSVVERMVEKEIARISRGE
jgi:cell pole-organizing protein PopZ